MEIILEMNSQGKNEKFKTKIADINNDNIFIHYPISLETNKTSFIPTGMMMFAHIVDEHSNAFSLETQVTGRIKAPVPMMTLHNPGSQKLMRVQRRQFVRIEAAVDIAFHFPISGTKFATITEDFSAGGCAAIIPPHVTINKDEQGKAVLVLPMKNKEYHYLELDCLITRITDKNNIRIASLKFLNSEQYERQLIRFGFEKQLEYRQKGMDV